MDYTLREWVDIAGNEPLSSAALQAQMEESGEDAEGILSRMQALLQCMKEAVRDGMQENLKSVSGMTGGQASRLFRRYQEGKAYCGSLAMPAWERLWQRRQPAHVVCCPVQFWPCWKRSRSQRKRPFMPCSQRQPLASPLPRRQALRVQKADARQNAGRLQR